MSDSRTILARLDPRIPAAELDRVVAGGRGESVERGGPVEPVEAASVLLVRDGQLGLEVFVQHRQLTMAFAPGMVTFPGGRREAGDRSLADCAVREVEEETGVVLHPDALRPWAHWITPACEPRRYDTYFFVAELSQAQQPTNRTTEATRAQWIVASEAVAEVTAGRWAMMPPTLSLVWELTELGSVPAVVEAAANRVIGTVLPVPRQHAELGWVWDYPSPGSPSPSGSASREESRP